MKNTSKEDPWDHGSLKRFKEYWRDFQFDKFGTGIKTVTMILFLIYLLLLIWFLSGVNKEQNEFLYNIIEITIMFLSYFLPLLFVSIIKDILGMNAKRGKLLLVIDLDKISYTKKERKHLIKYTIHGQTLKEMDSSEDDFQNILNSTEDDIDDSTDLNKEIYKFINGYENAWVNLCMDAIPDKMIIHAESDYTIDIDYPEGYSAEHIQQERLTKVKLTIEQKTEYLNKEISIDDLNSDFKLKIPLEDGFFSKKTVSPKTDAGETDAGETDAEVKELLRYKGSNEEDKIDKKNLLSIRIDNEESSKWLLNKVKELFEIIDINIKGDQLDKKAEYFINGQQDQNDNSKIEKLFFTVQIKFDKKIWKKKQKEAGNLNATVKYKFTFPIDKEDPFKMAFPRPALKTKITINRNIGPQKHIMFIPSFVFDEMNKSSYDIKCKSVDGSDNNKTITFENDESAPIEKRFKIAKNDNFKIYFLEGVSNNTVDTNNTRTDDNNKDN
jgi:hypothetical protein